MNNRILTWSTNIILYLFIYTHCSISKKANNIIWGKAHYILGNMRLKSSAFFSHYFFNSISHFSQMFTWRINICEYICIYKKIFFSTHTQQCYSFFSYKNLFFFSQLQNNSSANRMCRNKAMLHFFNVHFLDNFSTFGNFFIVTYATYCVQS